MQEIPVKQGTARWRQLRAGRPTASRFDLIVTNDGEPRKGDQREDYLYRLVCEIILGHPIEEKSYRARAGMINWAAHGIEQEPHAADWFETMHKCKLVHCGFMLADDERFGASPDRRIEGTNELVEIKCPAEWNLMRFLLKKNKEDRMDEALHEFWCQLQGELYVSGYSVVHLFIYHPEMPDVYRRVTRNVEFIDKLHTALCAFADERDRLIGEAKKLWPRQAG